MHRTQKVIKTAPTNTEVWPGQALLCEDLLCSKVDPSPAQDLCVSCQILQSSTCSSLSFRTPSIFYIYHRQLIKTRTIISRCITLTNFENSLAITLLLNNDSVSRAFKSNPKGYMQKLRSTNPQRFPWNKILQNMA